MATPYSLTLHLSVHDAAALHAHALEAATSGDGAMTMEQTTDSTVLVDIEKLSDLALDWAVAVCEGQKPLRKLEDDTTAAGVLPYSFDLHRDIKLRSEVDAILAGEPHCSGLGAQELREFAAELGYVIDEPVLPPYSSEWKRGGPIIDRECISITQFGGVWKASTLYQSAVVGPTHLVAAMRCRVASKMGMQVRVPAHLIETQR